MFRTLRQKVMEGITGTKSYKRGQKHPVVSNSLNEEYKNNKTTCNKNKRCCGSEHH